MSTDVQAPGPRSEASAERRLQYQPALDGLRAVALLGVVAYHAGIEGVRGGFLGVSTFFTLSGFLITSLLIRERVATGGVSLADFWVRRIRRLMPAALVTIVATVLLAATIGDDSQLDRLRGDALASLFHFSNWRFIAEGDSYGALFQSPSFFRHFWSLAVEEQYYLAVPPLLAAGLAVAGRRRTGSDVRRSRGFAAFLVVVAGAGLLWPPVLAAGDASSDRLYFGTDSRLGELTVGAVLALWFVRREQRVADSPRGVAAATVATLGAIVVTGLMWHSAHPADEYLYRGGLALHALLTVPVIVAAVAPRGPVRAVLSLEPLRRLGVISYGAYLTHWPILLWLQQETGLGPVARFGVGLAVTVAVSLVMHRVVELPFRTGRVRTVRHQVWVAVPASLAVAGIVLAVTAWRQPSTIPIDFAAAQEELADLIADGGAGPDDVGPGDASAPDEPTAGPDEGRGPEDEAPVRLAAFGDSTGLMTGLGIGRWAEANPGVLDILQGDARLGCGLVSGGNRRVEGRVVAVPDDCDGWLDYWITVLGDEELDVAVIQLGAWEVTDHQLEPGGSFRSIEDADYRELQVAQLDDLITALLERAEVVALLSQPDVGEARLATVPAGTSYPEHDPARARAWRDLVAAAADGPDAPAPDRTIVVDLASWIADQPDDARLRPDGVHFSRETGAEVAEWLVPEIMAGVAEARAATDPGPNPDDPPAPEPSPRILLTGDSLMVDTAGALEAALATADPSVVVAFEGQPARPRTAAQTAEWQARAEAFDPDVVIEYFGYWEIAATAQATPPFGDPGFAEGYRRDVLDPWFDHLASLEATVIDIGAAPARVAEVGEAIAATMDIVADDLADRGGVWFLPSASVLTPDGYADVLPDPRTGESERVRRVDGLHLCPAGAERVADIVLELLATELGIAVDDTWRSGSWRTELPIDLAAECPSP